MLAYCRIQNKQNEWVGCECCFTIVYDVMVVCTSIYRRNLQSESTFYNISFVCGLQLTCFRTRN